MPALLPESNPALSPAEVPERYAEALERADARRFSKRKPIDPQAESKGSPIPVDEKQNRHAFLRLCISIGLNAPQISLLSLSTKFPMRAHQSVYEAIDAQGLGRLYTSRRIQNRRKGFHNASIIKVFMKLYYHGSEADNEITDVFRDEIPLEGLRFRPDLGMTIGNRRFFVEVQLSKLEYTRWSVKMRNYLQLYRKLKEPFRVLKLVDRAEDIPKLRQYAREVLHEHPNLNLFLFMTLADYFRQWDILHSPCWEWAWTPRRLVTLM